MFKKKILNKMELKERRKTNYGWMSLEIFNKTKNKEDEGKPFYKLMSLTILKKH